MIIFFKNSSKPDQIKDFDLNPYIERWGPHFTPQLADYASNLMENVDGSTHKWSCKDITKLISTLKLAISSDFTIGDIMYLANMAYADFYPKLLTDTNHCILYAYAILEDPDGYEGIAFYRWLADVKQKEIEIPWSKFC